jgi:hypothetical protein
VDVYREFSIGEGLSRPFRAKVKSFHRPISAGGCTHVWRVPAGEVGLRTVEGSRYLCILDLRCAVVWPCAIQIVGSGSQQDDRT